MTSDWNYKNTNSEEVENSRTLNLIGRIGQMPQYPDQPMPRLSMMKLFQTTPNASFPNTSANFPGNSHMEMNPDQMFRTSPATPAGQLFGYGHLGRPIWPNPSTYPVQLISTPPLAIEYGSSSSQAADHPNSGRLRGRRSTDHKTPCQMTSLKKFPYNAKSLILSKVFDGVPVMYSSSSRKNNLRGIIKSPGYLCGCDHCKFKTVIKAQGLEIHAGCPSTKHPNDRIYFSSGKTIPDLVHELQKATSPDNLYQTIKTGSGSAINIPNFRLWKSKHEAAMRAEIVSAMTEEVENVPDN